jgi:hypothetical protein
MGQFITELTVEEDYAKSEHIGFINEFFLSLEISLGLIPAGCSACFQLT